MCFFPRKKENSTMYINHGGNLTFKSFLSSFGLELHHLFHYILWPSRSVPLFYVLHMIGGKLFSYFSLCLSISKFKFNFLTDSLLPQNLPIKIYEMPKKKKNKLINVIVRFFFNSMCESAHILVVVRVWALIK
jgi:hypothetical protein